MAELKILFSNYLPFLVIIAGACLVLWAAHWLLLRKRLKLGAEARVPRQLLMLIVIAAVLVVMLLLMPMSETTRGQILSLFGLVITAVIALSSTTFVSNAMAGMMLRILKSFRPGDFILIGQEFGRVTERGLFHTEIQTEDRYLTTLPNLHLITNPVTVVDGTGTIISATLSLGYDVPRIRVDELLKKAAEEAKLEDPFVLIKELNDYSVSYKVGGFLADVKQLLTIKSNLRKYILDAFHRNGVEIVSPTYMNQRQIDPKKKIIPVSLGYAETKPKKPEVAPEEIIFDKAEVAAEIEQLRDEYNSLLRQVKELSEAKKTAAEPEQQQLASKIEWLEHRLEVLKKLLAAEEEATEKKE
ncbi:MAG: mechanosensitive ion channel family protein [Gammaproteobacteria bacterium]|nr:mechanosensitive ion channel family protein [Gammaproteobacteria bacterium]